MAARSVIEELGTVAAVSVARDRVPWALALAGLVTTPFWASPFVAVPCVAIVVTILFRVPWLPARVLAGRVVAAVAAAAWLVGVVAWGDDDYQALWRGLGGLAGAVALLGSVAVARAQRAGCGPEDAESAAGRLVVWAQDHPWAVALVCIGIADPVTCLLLAAVQAASAELPGMGDAAGLQWTFVGALLVAASAAPRSFVRAGEILVVATVVVHVSWTAAFHGLSLAAGGGGPGASDLIDGVVQSGAVLLPILLTLLLFRRRALAYRPVRGSVVLVTVAVVDLAASVAAVLVLTSESSIPTLRLAVHGVRGVVHAALLAEAAASVVPGRRLLGGAVVLGTLTPVAIAGVLGDPSALHATIPVSVAAFARDVVFALAARRLLSMTVVPRDHPLRTDWGVDLKSAGLRT